MGIKKRNTMLHSAKINVIFFQSLIFENDPDCYQSNEIKILVSHMWCTMINYSYWWLDKNSK